MMNWVNATTFNSSLVKSISRTAHLHLCTQKAFSKCSTSLPPNNMCFILRSEVIQAKKADNYEEHKFFQFYKEGQHALQLHLQCFNDMLSSGWNKHVLIVCSLGLWQWHGCNTNANDHFLFCPGPGWIFVCPSLKHLRLAGLLQNVWGVIFFTEKEDAFETVKWLNTLMPFRFSSMQNSPMASSF